MTPEQRLIRLVTDSASAVGGQSALARHLSVTPQLVCNWIKGRGLPHPVEVVKMQDLLKRAACLLMTSLALSYTPSGEAKPASAHKFDRLHIVPFRRLSPRQRSRAAKQLRQLLDNANRVIALYLKKLNLAGETRDVAITYLASTAIPHEPAQIAKIAERIHGRTLVRRSVNERRI